MISILIPNFNYKCQDLVNTLVNEIQNNDFNSEIIISDDASTLASVKEIYIKLESLPNVRIIKNKVNLGREKTRANLAKEAAFNWLLFLDADVLPQKKNFIKNYVESVQKNNKLDLVFGGIIYGEKPLDANLLLRWKYGKTSEEQSLASRKKNKYLSLITGAICIKKEDFLKHSVVLDHIYGLDILLAYQLKKTKAQVLHIENPVFHLGLETNSAFLRKTECALKSIILLEDKDLISTGFRPIQRVYAKLKKLKLLVLCDWLYSISNSYLTKNITSKSPNLFHFKVYRMLYFCYLKKSQSVTNG